MEGWIVAISLTRGRAEKLSFAQLCFFFKFSLFFFFFLFLSYEAVKVSSRGMIFSFKVGRGGGRVIQAASLERIIWAN